MDSLRQKIIGEFGNRLRLRVCGISIRDESILLVRHAGIGSEGVFWSPPGGGAEFGMPVKENLVREMREETGLCVEPGRLLFVFETLKPPLHAVEMFFEVTITGGSLITGTDPEMPEADQIIREVRFVPFEEIRENPPHRYHAMVNQLARGSKIEDLSGFLGT